ncbi:MAG: AAA family ATPase [Atopobiaceae bacterium]|nr:AAA family ATPase [Atopobiaceae bacterium]
MGSATFSWVPAYEAIATSLLGYEERQSELCDIVYDVIGERYKAMDPLTFFSMFNGKRRNAAKRAEAVSKISKAMGIDVEVPSDFEGVPMTNAQRWRFWDGKPGTIENNWGLFKAAVAFADSLGEDKGDELERLFDIVHAQGNIGDATLTMALFWARPRSYLPLDSYTRSYLHKELGVLVPSPLKGKGYLQMLYEVRSVTDASFPSISYDSWEPSSEDVSALGDEDVDTTHYWLYSPGTDASMWDEFYGEGCMGLGWGELGDLLAYGSKAEIRSRLQVINESNSHYFNAVQITWQFAHDIKPGDVVFAKRGLREVIGRGVVEGDYEYEPDVYGEYPNRRKVRWTNRGSWTLDSQFAVKALTEVTDYTDFVATINACFEGEDTEDEVVAEPASALTPYSKADFLAQVFMDEGQYDTLVGVLRTKKNVILQGAPGVGKTFVAKRLAYSMMGVKDPERVMMVQFHQSYSYEDFIEGYRPSKDGFELVRGAFYTFCKRAAEDDENDYFFIIDEINRGNLSRIFGELFMLIENDKRGPKNKLQLLYSRELFHVPSNVYLVGMMNTADRSLAMLDYALRRRFAFFDLRPAFGSDGFVAYRDGLASAKLNDLLACVVRLNEDIAKDETLGEGFCIGHSYFCNMRPGDVTDARLSAIVEYELVPMLREYWFDEPGKVREWSERLRRAVK